MIDLQKKVVALFDAICAMIDRKHISPITKVHLLNTIFCRCDECGTPLFVRHVTEFPKGVTKIYCPECLAEKEVVA